MTFFLAGDDDANEDGVEDEYGLTLLVLELALALVALVVDDIKQLGTPTAAAAAVDADADADGGGCTAALVTARANRIIGRSAAGGGGNVHGHGLLLVAGWGRCPSVGGPSLDGWCTRHAHVVATWQKFGGADHDSYTWI